MRVLLTLILITVRTEALKYSSNFNEYALNTNEGRETRANYTIDNAFDDLISRYLVQLDDRTDESEIRWPKNVIKCARTIGVYKCLRTFMTSRIEKAAKLKGDVEFDIARELDVFKWEKFVNTTDDNVDSRLRRGMSDLINGRNVTLSTFPGILVDLNTQNNGTLNIDFRKDQNVSFEGRGRNNWRKRFYHIIPILLIPSLIMSAVLPFVLPAMKLMTVAVGLLNQFALWGAVFNLMRNNAFDDKYEKRVIYLNEGYKNEIRTPSYGDHSNYFSAASEDEFQYDNSNNYLEGGRKRKSGRRRQNNNRRKPLNTGGIKSQKEFEEEVEYEIPEEFLNSPSMKDLVKVNAPLLKNMFGSGLSEYYEDASNSNNNYFRPSRVKPKIPFYNRI